MYYSIKAAEHVGGHKLLLHFEDGSSGVVDFSKYIRRGGVFRRLADADVFRSFEINRDFGVVSWGDVEIAPETLYESVHRGSVERAGLAMMTVAERADHYVTKDRKRR